MAEPGQRVGGYVLQRRLHQGGAFDYWLAKDPDRRSRVVVALMHSPLLYDDDLRQHAIERLQARRGIHHPRIPALKELIADDGLSAIYTYVPGISCRELLLRSQGGLPPEVAARIVEQIARTLHQARVPPRWAGVSGVEPSNVLIDPSGAAHLLLAPVFESRSDVTGVGVIAGAILYLSPEAIRGLPLLPQSTVFSLGVLLYELIAGRHPFFENQSTMLTLRRIIDVEYEPIANRLSLDPRLEAIIDRALTAQPEERWVHSGELADGIHRALAHSANDRSVSEMMLRLCPELEAMTEDVVDTERTDPADAPAAHLLAEIDSDPDAIDPYLVYADWLQSRGDRRGELIVLQHRELASEAAKLLAAHPQLIGEAAKWLDQPQPKIPEFQAGPHFIGELAKGPLAAEWHLGFVRSLRMTLGPDLGASDLEALIRGLEAEQSMRFLRHLAIGPAQTTTYSMDHAYAVLAGCRLELESLYAGDLSALAPTATHRATANVSSAFPSLKRLAIRGAEIHLGRLLLPELRELRIFSSGLTADCINHIASSSLANLELLELWLGGAPARSAWPDRVALLFEERHLPKLRHLVLSEREQNAMTGMMVMLVQSDLAARLETLDLLNSAMPDAAAQILLQSADRFASLRELRFDERHLSPEIAAHLGERYSSQNLLSGPTSSIG